MALTSAERKKRYRESEHGKAATKAYYERNRDAYTARSRFYRTGFTPAMFDAMWREQGGLCAMGDCRKSLDGDVAADHDHETGAARGLLCQQCNLKLGQWEATRKRAAAFQEYLDASQVLVHGPREAGPKG